MSAPIPIIKKEENTGGYFASWFKKQKDKENVEQEIFEMSDDELPPKLTPKPPQEKDLDDVDDFDDEQIEEQDEYCYGFPCTNNKYFGYCKKCEDDSICSLIVESVQQGFYDMKDDIKCLWERDVVKVWTVFLTVCYFNCPNEALFAGAFYYMNQKFEDHEKKLTSQSTLPPVTDSESDDEEETKKCV